MAAGNTTAAPLSGLDQQRLANQGKALSGPGCHQCGSRSIYPHSGRRAQRKGIPLSLLSQIKTLCSDGAGFWHHDGTQSTTTPTNWGSLLWAQAWLDWAMTGNPMMADWRHCRPRGMFNSSGLQIHQRFRPFHGLEDLLMSGLLD